MQATLHRTRFVAALNDIFVGYLTKPDRPLRATKSPQWKFGAHGTGVNFDYRGEASRSVVLISSAFARERLITKEEKI